MARAEQAVEVINIRSAVAFRDFLQGQAGSAVQLNGLIGLQSPDQGCGELLADIDGGFPRLRFSNHRIAVC